MRIFAHLTVLLFTSFLSLTFLSREASADPHEDLLKAASSWTNQSGSVATLSFEASPDQRHVYIISGHYINRATGYRCQGSAYPLTGIYHALTYSISFSVAWSNSLEDCQSVTGWTGYLTFAFSSPRMVTDWNLAFLGTTGPRIIQGGDTFTLNRTIKSEGLKAD